MKIVILTSLVVLGLSSAAYAQASTPDFVTLDTDQSGGISLSEAQVAFPNLTDEPYAAADTDANGELSPQEFGLAASAVVPDT